jgi:hypothetical protein
MNQRLASNRFRCASRGDGAMDRAVVAMAALAALVTIALPMSGLARALFGIAG